MNHVQEEYRNVSYGPYRGWRSAGYRVEGRGGIGAEKERQKAADVLMKRGNGGLQELWGFAWDFLKFGRLIGR
jgi:hypothetical protein